MVQKMGALNSSEMLQDKHAKPDMMPGLDTFERCIVA